MTPKEINIKIAESLGWSPEETNEWVEDLGERSGHWRLTQRPDYYHSLDACAEFEAPMTKENRYDYGHFLRLVLMRDLNTSHPTSYDFATATAPQRCWAYSWFACRASLKVKGVWK